MSAWISSAMRPPLSGHSLLAVQLRELGTAIHATQHITFDDVKCCGSPRTSQMPRSGSRQCFDRLLDLAFQHRPQRSEIWSRDLACR